MRTHKIINVCLIIALFTFASVLAWTVQTTRSIVSLLDIAILAQSKMQIELAESIDEAGICTLRDVVCPQEESELPVDQLIIKVANERGYDDPSVLVRLADCESNLNPAAVGGDLDSFRGLYQWNKRSNPNITDECAFDVRCSTEVTVTALERGESWRWPNCF